jgi:serine/threonine protein kinase
MDSAKWERLKDVFEEATSMSGDERSLFLRTACAGDDQLHAEVERLLSQAAAAAEFFRTPAAGHAASTPEVPHSFLDGQLVCQRFVIRRFIGRGGMGEVYAAEDKVTGVMVALKTIRGEVNSDQRLCAAFRKEVQLARRVTHKNVCRIHDLFEHCLEQAGERCVRRIQILSMELLEGETLAQLLKERQRITVNEAIPILRQIAEGLAAVHRAGVVHRDLKPANVFLTSSKTGEIRAVLTDFGLARGDANDSVWSGLSGPTVILGTPKYMSPEQLEGSTADIASDMYSLGAIWYEMLTGHAPHESSSATSSALKRLSEDPPSPRKFIPDLNIQVEKAVLKCLQRDPSRRFAGIADLLLWFDAYESSRFSESIAQVPSEGPASETRDQNIAGVLGTASNALKEKSKTRSDPSAAVRKKARRRWWIAGVCIAVFAIAPGVWFLLRPRSQQLESRVIPLVSYPGFQRDPAFSPDGNQIAFAWTGLTETTTHIYVKVIGTDIPLQLTARNIPDAHPAWAPDGKSIAFLRSLSQAEMGVYEVPPLGGPARRIGEVRSGLYPALSWSHDGKWLITTGRQGPNRPSQIFAISAESGEQRPLWFGDPRDEFYPALSQDSRFLAFSRMYGDADWAIFTVGLDNKLQPNGPPYRLNTPYGLNRQAAWTANGQEIIFANGGSATRLWRASAHNNNPARQLPITGEAAYQPAVARVGDRLAYTHDFNNANIWSVVVRADGKAGQPTQVIASARSSWIRPNAISLDGRMIAFESNRSGPYGIWISNRDGSNARFLFGNAAYISGSPAWSPDGNWLAFDTRKDKKVQIYVISAEGGAAHRVTQTQADNLVPHWSRDGKWIYFDSNRTGRFEIFKASPQGGDEIQVTHNGGWGPQESPDGKFLFYTRTRAVSTPLFKLPLNGGQEVQILPSVHERWWAVGDRGIWFMQVAGTELDPGLWTLENPATDHGYLRFLSFAHGTLVTVSTFSKSPAGGLAISGDRRALMFNQVDHRATEILLMENFR